MIENVAYDRTLNLQLNAGEGVQPSPPLFSAKNSSDVQTQSRDSRQSVEIAKNENDEAVRYEKSVAVMESNRSSPKNDSEDTGLDQEKIRDMEESLQKINEKLAGMNREIQYKVDENTNRFYFSIVDKKTKEVIKEVPPPEVRKFAASLKDFLEKLDSGEKLGHLFINMKV